MLVTLGSERDNEFNLEAQQALYKVHLEARQQGWTPARLIAAANLNLHLGHLANAEAFARKLALTHPEEAGEIFGEATRLRQLPLRTRKDREE